MYFVQHYLQEMIETNITIRTIGSFIIGVSFMPIMAVYGAFFGVEHFADESEVPIWRQVLDVLIVGGGTGLVLAITHNYLSALRYSAAGYLIGLSVYLVMKRIKSRYKEKKSTIY